jgi:hypothetical protein
MDMLTQFCDLKVGGGTIKELRGNEPPPILVISSILGLNHPSNFSSHPNPKFMYQTLSNIMVA